MVYEATFKETHVYDSVVNTMYGNNVGINIGYTFDEVMEYCVEC